ncbi:PREDICTED: polycomb protein sop-2-like [Papilio xuthus]|uniref:Polycomb protein sop-2-like n=1 Tax=Papilio xuthus TaxID=66420 RepID=A0AAJ6ZIK2_PAPXU|nr:PREDICTED: polycomb protein sop-2-like [Papilio xuthus]
MNSSRSDASTSTEDMKTRPLCLYYFTHPFGVLSPEPPRLAAFVPTAPAAPTAPAESSATYAPTASTAFDLANWARMTCASSWFSEDMWSWYGGRASARLPPLRVRRLLSGVPGGAGGGGIGARTPPRSRRALPPLPEPPPIAPSLRAAPRSPRPGSARARLSRKMARSLHTTFIRGREERRVRGKHGGAPAAWALPAQTHTSRSVPRPRLRTLLPYILLIALAPAPRF